jgi:hypothetical protein
MTQIVKIDKLFADLESKDDKVRYPAFKELLSLSEEKVNWIYDKWFELTGKLKSDNSYQRSIGLMLLANLAKSDSENRLGTILDMYLEFFEDEKFITSRQCIQNVWKIAIANEKNRERIVKELQKTYYENINHHKHSNLIKQDIIGSLNMISQQTKDEEIRKKIVELIDSELDEKLIKTLRKIVKDG